MAPEVLFLLLLLLLFYYFNSIFLYIFYIILIVTIIFRMHQASSKWSPERRVAYIHVGEPSELGSL
jgi:4-hydroxybenzoate polyprenyltransferase